MYTEINDDERDQIYNKEPSKCKGWFWTNIEQCKEYKEKLFYPLRTMLNELPDLQDIKYLKKMSEREIL